MAGSPVYISATTDDAAQECGCGCCNDLSGELEQLEYPRFFCGQLLTDEDLNALRDWVQAKFRRQRHRHGYGVVCGLNLSCDSDDPAGVQISPGYAVGHCGRDIVVSQTDRLNLTDACDLPVCDCADISAQSDKTEVKCYTADIYVKSNALSTTPLPALGSGACSEKTACEPSREKESYEFFWKPASGGEHPLQAALKKWEADYFSISREIVDDVVTAAYIGEGGYDYSGKLSQIRAILQAWLTRHPPFHFGFLRDAVEQVTAAIHSESFQKQLTDLLLALVMDCRLAYLAKTHPETDGADGVPLGRVVLMRQTDGSACKVEYIEAIAPYRRGFGNDRWPAPPGMFNLGQLVWQASAEACARIRSLGAFAFSQQMATLTAPHKLQEKLNQEWPDSTKKSESGESPVGLFLDLDCSHSSSLYRLLKINTFSINAALSSAGRRAVSFMYSSSGAGGQYEDKFSRPPKTDPVKEASPPETEDRSSSDRLAEIHGIGPEREQKLHQHGIHTFAQLAAANLVEIQKIFPRISAREIKAWLSQAGKLGG